MRVVQFTSNGSNSVFGNFAAGDTLRCGDAMARHLVREARVAKFMEPAADAPPAESPSKPARSRRVQTSAPPAAAL